MKIAKFTTGLILLSTLLVSTSFAINQLDNTFNAVPATVVPDSPEDKGQLVQPDGKVIVWGGALAADGLAKGQIARLNVDGTVDTTFTYCGCDFVKFINAALGLDGKIFVAGADGIGQARVVRLNADGSADPTFISSMPIDHQTTSTARVWQVQPDGKIFVEKETTNQANVTIGLYRLNTDGTVDISSSIPFGGPYNTMTDLRLLPDGKFLIASYSLGVGGIGYDGFVQRKNADGTPDPTWTEPDFAPSFGFSGGSRVLGLDVQADGGIIVGGKFSTVNGFTKANLVRLLPAGNVDLNFSGPASFLSVGIPRILQNGDILVTAVTDASNQSRFHRLHADGTEDSARGEVNAREFSKADAVGKNAGAPEFTPSSIVDVQNRYVLDASEHILFFGKSDQASQRFFRLNSDGSQDESFGPNVGDFGQVTLLARQIDGKVIVIGDYGQMNGVTRVRISRVNSDGTLDTSFDAGNLLSQLPNSVLVQPDGKILIGGNQNLVRLNSNGSVDNTYTPGFGVAGMALQSDGKLVVIGGFSAPHAGIKRLNPDGSLDAGFNPVIGGTPNLTAVAIHPDGKITFSGSFNGVNGFNRTAMARLNSDGSLDQTFTLASGNSPRLFWLQPDGKYLFTNTGSGDATLARLNSAGTVDSSFSRVTFSYPPSSSEARVDSVVTQSNGKIMVGGNFFRINSTLISNVFRFYFIRLNTNGSLDTSYVQNDPNGEVRTVIKQPDGKVVIGGDFTAVEGVQRAGIARIILGEATARNLPFDFDGDGRSDLGVFRPSDGNWYVAKSQAGFSVQHFGISGDLVVSADYDGDGISDLAINRNGAWWYVNSHDGSLGLKNWGAAGDIPLPSDFDGDGKADFIYYHPATGEWFRSGSTGINSTVVFGIAGDVSMSADMDGDGKTDPTIFRPSNGQWWYLSSATGVAVAAQWGQSGDVPVAADYDGDGRADIAVWRPSNGAWYIYNSGSGTVTIFGWGLAEDKPVVADYDGDGRADIAVWRPSNGVWYIMQSTSGFTGMQYGLASDKAIPNELIF
jgi:uncharacterized delta-60 repeat protein